MSEEDTKFSGVSPSHAEPDEVTEQVIVNIQEDLEATKAIDGNADAPPADKEDDLKKDNATGNLSWIVCFTCLFGGLASFFLFLVGLSLMGSSFKAMAGSGASALFGAVQDPIAGLMVGILATVLVQSSSTSTSIVVAMVASDAIEVRNAIPIIMGANIGTSVTAAIVSMGQVGVRIDLERAFASATVHHVFNLLTVGVLLPLEWICSLSEGSGGPIYWITFEITKLFMGGEGGSKMFTSPIKVITAPVVDAFLKANKYIIYAKSLGKPAAQKPASVCQGICKPLSGGTSVSCPKVRRLESENHGYDYSRALISKRRLADKSSSLHDLDCGEYACVPEALASNYKKANKKAYKELIKCGDALPKAAFDCGKQACYLGGSKYFDEEVTGGRLISKGFLKSAGDEGGGIIGVLIALLMMSIGLIGLSKALQKVFITKAKALIKYSTKLNDYLAIIVGLGCTIVVQSSSVTTSVLTPLAGLGVIPLKKILPMTVGANIGTTCTALIAAFVDLKFSGVQIALAHFFFNVLGMLMWFPVPRVRAIPLDAAAVLGQYASFYRSVPLLYVLTCFLAIPAIMLCVAFVFYASIVGGIVLVVFIAVVTAVFEFWWWKGFGSAGPGCFKVLSQEQRAHARKELVASNAAMMGISEEEYERTADALSWSGN